MAIIGVLAAGLLIVLNPSLQLKRSRDTDRKADLKVIQSALEAYRSDCGEYPTPTASNSLGATLATVLSNCDNKTATYLQSVPVDPRTTGVYYYCVTSGCGASTGGYALYACLENNSEVLSSEVIAISGSGVTMTTACPSGATKYFKAINP